MPLRKIACIFALVLAGAAAQTPLAELRIDAVPGGSVIFVRNTGSQPLTAYLIELVDYPGSSFVLWRDALVDDESAYTEPGMEKRIPVTNLSVGAVPDHVNVRAAIYADGTTAGLAEKVTLLLDRRRTTLEATREAIRRVETTPHKAALITGLTEWASALTPAGRTNGTRRPPSNRPSPAEWCSLSRKRSKLTRLPK
jgi:hypothetical protein